MCGVCVVVCCVVIVFRTMLLSKGALKKKMHCGRNPVSGELDNKVLEYVEMARKKGREPLNDQQVQQVARDFGKEMGVTGFKASWSWLKRWKGRCDALKESTATAEENTGHYDMHATHNSVHEEASLSHCRTIFSPYQLTVLSESDEKSIVCLDKCVNEARERPPSTDAVCTFDYSSPEHNYSMILPSNASSSQLAYQDCPTPNLQSNVVELLENVALLHAHDQAGMELTLGDRLEGSFLHGASPDEKISSNIDASSSVLRQDTLCPSAFLDYEGLDVSQEFTCPVPSSSSILEEEQLMSVFNHRSFTDPFPFLPTSFICCPSEQAHSFSTDGIGIDELLETQLFDNTNRRSRKKAKSKQSRILMSCSDSSGIHNSYLGSGGKQVMRPYCASPSNPEHKNSPPHGSLLGSPSYPSGLLASSPPGGLLASRRSQPIFPDEPEIVFHEIQLGSLHTTPTV